MLNMVCSQMLYLGSHFVRHFVTLNDIFRMANIDFWIQRPWNRVKRYVGLNTNKMRLDYLNDDLFKNPTWLMGTKNDTIMYNVNIVKYLCQLYKQVERQTFLVFSQLVQIKVTLTDNVGIMCLTDSFRGEKSVKSVRYHLESSTRETLLGPWLNNI